MSPPFARVLVANRGEIAVRIIRACHDLGMEAVAVYSDADASAIHVRQADLAVRVGPPPPAESYLRIETIVEAALRTGCQAVHPGYGFLAERAAFAAAVEGAGLAFVGPPSIVIAQLGDKLSARRLARSAGVPVVPGTLRAAPVGIRGTPRALERAAAEVGFPLLVKAAAGGGGRGMRRVVAPAELPSALAIATAEAEAAFGDGAVYLEREIAPARHLEVQLLGDAGGTVVAVGERDCSIQRRHQKLVEEAPAPGLSGRERRTLHDMAVRVATAAGLRNASTAEFLLTPERAFHFLEVNTRLQVEHGVTELVTGLDLVHEQLRLAAGERISPGVMAAVGRAADPGRHAIEVRIAAEDPGRAFAPTPGPIRHWSMPSGPGIRVDAGVEAGHVVPAEYDNLLAKVMVVARDRRAAVRRLARALSETEIGGLQTTLPFHRFVAGSPAFVAARLSTGWVDEHWDGPRHREAAARRGQVAAGLFVLRGSAGDGSASRHAAQGAGWPTREEPDAWVQAGRIGGVDRWPEADRRPVADRWSP